MLTTCTACGTQFRVDTIQLRTVHGLVRCGRCQSVFDAFETLKEEFAPAASSPNPAADELRALAEELSKPAVDAPPPVPPSLVAPAPAPTAPDLLIDATATAAPSDDLLREVWGDDAIGDARAVQDPTTLEPEPLLIEEQIPEPTELELDQKLYSHTELPPREPPATASPARRRRIRIWGIGALILAVLLAAQVINAQRAALARTAVVGPMVSAVYTAFGHPLGAAPAADNIWQISDTNVTSDPDTPGALAITGRLQNNAVFAETWPTLRVELTDRDGNPVRASDFTAGEYLPANRAATWLGPGMAAEFRIDVVDPGADAVGFTIRPCSALHGARACNGTANGNT
ncbi:MAG: zinc-ribbon and DUF3426 domain-containing protein [Gammaproteobacteria bacterium]